MASVFAAQEVDSETAIMGGGGSEIGFRVQGLGFGVVPITRGS